MGFETMDKSRTSRQAMCYPVSAIKSQGGMRDSVALAVDDGAFVRESEVMVTRIGKRGVLKAAALALIAAAAFAAATFATAMPASAQSSYCSRIQADYLSAVRSSSGGGSTDIRRLRSELASAEAEAKRKNCRRFLFFGKRASRDCPAVMGKVNRLRRQVSQASGGGWGATRQTVSRDRLYSELRRNGCEIPSLGETASSGYRTLCVRTCDGYYFPVNFRSSRSRFKIDETVCKSMYGGAGAELFVHANGRGAENAVSLAGRPLADEPYAFAYRSTFNESCQIELKAGLENLKEVFASTVAAAQANGPVFVERTPAPILLPAPVARVHPSHDPETLANLAGGFKVVPVTPPGQEAVVVASSSIRRLGPDYYYQPPPTIEALYEPPDLGPEFSLIGSAHAAERPKDDADPTGSTTVQ
jgi:hypothetical protein